MKYLNKEKKGSPIPVRFKSSVEKLLRKESFHTDRSLNYLIEQAVIKSYPELKKTLKLKP